MHHGLILCVLACTACEDILAPSRDHSADDLPGGIGAPPTTEIDDEAPIARPAHGGYDTDAANAHAARINPHRGEHGIDALVRSACLDAIARRWARRMASGACGDNDPICHRPDRGPSSLEAQVSRCWPWLGIGENVAMGRTEPRLFRAFLDSPGHHANIDRDWNVVAGSGKYGVGVFRRSDGYLFVTQVFATRR